MNEPSHAPAPPPPTPRRTALVVARRLLIGVLAALCAGLLLAPGHVLGLLPRPELEVIDLGARAQALAAADLESETEWYHFGPSGSAHLHLIGPGLTCELHLHERSLEVSLPVLGTPRVGQLAGPPAQRQVVTLEPSLGAAVVSRPGCAHLWGNSSPDTIHAALVFTLGKVFGGNQFVTSGDRRVASCEEPSAFDAAQDLPCEQGVACERLLAQAPGGATLTALRVVDRLEVAPAGPTLFYVVDGEGRFEAGVSLPRLGPSTLLVSRLTRPATLVAEPTRPLLVYQARLP